METVLKLFLCISFSYNLSCGGSSSKDTSAKVHFHSSEKQKNNHLKLHVLCPQTLRAKIRSASVVASCCFYNVIFHVLTSEIKERSASSVFVLQTVAWTVINNAGSCWFWPAGNWFAPDPWAASLRPDWVTARCPAVPQCPHVKVILTSQSHVVCTNPLRLKFNQTLSNLGH